MYITTFKVTGNFIFPLDMLRYDACYPHTQVDVENIITEYTPDNKGKHFTVELCRMHQDKGWKPTVGRWESFGYRVELRSALKV